MHKKDIIVIGAGASGMMCAIESGKRGRSVLVLDHADRIGKKIRISGGGCCNFTNISVSHESYISDNPHFCKSALSRFGPRDFTAMLEKHGINYEERDHGQLFCTGSSEEIIEMLEKECNSAGVNIILNCQINNVNKKESFIISTDNGTFESGSLVIATGGLSYPRIGASGIGYDIARQLGLKVTQLRPALVPFIFSPEDLRIFGELSGISINCNIKCNKREFRESILFTHRGLSGPGILQISSYWKVGDVIVIDLLPGIDILSIFIERQTNR